MGVLIWIGAALTCVGVGMLGWCAMEAMRAKRTETDDAALKARLQKVVAVNLGALAISAFGLMAVVLGIILG